MTVVIARRETPHLREPVSEPPPPNGLAAWAWPAVLVFSGVAWALIFVLFVR